MKLKIIFIITFIIISINLKASQCIMDSRTLTEYLLSPELKYIFICKLEKMIPQDIKYEEQFISKDKRIGSSRRIIEQDYIYLAKILKIYFGKIDTDYVFMHTQYEQQINDTFLIYNRSGNGKNFSFGNGYCVQRTKKISDVSELEINTLNNISDIINNRKTKNCIIKNDDKIVAIGKFKKGIPIKTWIHNFENGMPKIKIEYKTGRWTTYYENGFIKSTYLKTKDSSVSENYSILIAGQIEYIVVFYKNDIQLSKKYKNGKIQHLHFSQAMIGYINDWIDYYENGNINIKGQFTNGKKSGEWITYNENGIIEKSEIFNETK